MQAMMRVLTAVWLIAGLTGCETATDRERRLSQENAALKQRNSQLEGALSQVRASGNPAQTSPDAASARPLATGTASPQLSAQQLIIPGQSLGRAVLGQPLSPGLLAAMGPPRRDGQVSPDYYVWPATPRGSSPHDYDLMIKTRSQGEQRIIGAIYTSLPDYRTSEGLGVGSSMPAVQQVFRGGQLIEGLGGPCWKTPLITFCSLDGKQVKTVFMGDSSL